MRGLNARPELNGVRATVLSEEAIASDAGEGRWEVRVWDREGTQVRIKASNLEPLMASMGAQGSPELPTDGVNMALREWMLKEGGSGFRHFLGVLQEGEVKDPPTPLLALQHRMAENLGWWADASDVAAVLSDRETVRKLLLQVTQENLKLGIAMMKVNEMTGQEAIVLFDCLGCQSPIAGPAHSECSDTESIVWTATLTHLCGDVNVQTVAHRAMVLLGLVCAVLAWEDERLEGAQQLMLEEAVADHNAMLVPTLVGTLDNCATTCPVAAHLAGGLIGLLVVRRPASVFADLDPVPMLDALHKYMGYIFGLVSNNTCSVEESFGITALLDVVPLLYLLADWRESHEQLKKRKIIADVGTLCVNLLHTSRVGAGDTPDDLEMFPELGRNLLVMRSVYGMALSGSTAATCLREMPTSFAAACTLEVLGRWSWQGLPMHGRCAQVPADDETCDVCECIEEYLEAACSLSRHESGAFRCIEPLAQQLSLRGVKAHVPSKEESLVRKVVNRAVRLCALPTCRSTGELISCAGGCQGLARYCCEAHQKQHWERHKKFCIRQKKH